MPNQFHAAGSGAEAEAEARPSSRTDPLHLIRPKPSSWFRDCIREAMDSGHDVKFHWGAYGTLTAKFYAGNVLVHEREWER